MNLNKILVLLIITTFSLFATDISGKVFTDKNNNRVYDEGEDTLSNIHIRLFKDVNDDGYIFPIVGDAIVAETDTDDNGDYQFIDVEDGDYLVQIIVNDPDIPSGSRLQTDNPIDVTISGDSVDSANFAFSESTIPADYTHDYGDAPESYPGPDGEDDDARHRIIDNFHLGFFNDADGNGSAEGDVNSDDALADDNANVDDEDGVQILDPIIPLKEVRVRVLASIGDAKEPKLEGFFDLNGNNRWTRDGEDLINDDSIEDGVNIYHIVIPDPNGDTTNGDDGKAFIRFKYYDSSSTSGVCCYGEADSGEVEDYEMHIGEVYSISGTVFKDSDKDGEKDADEDPLPNVKVGLYKDFDRDGVIDESDIVQEMNTTDDGEYLFKVPPNLKISRGDYLVVVDTNDSDIPDNLKLNGANPLEATMNDQNISGKDFPFIEKTISIGDTVWLDENLNGLQDSNESGIAGVKLILVKGSSCSGSEAIDNNTTDDSGNYIFKNLEQKTTYTVCIDKSQFVDKKGVDDTVLEKMVLTIKDANDNSDDTIDSDIQNSESGEADITLTTGDYGDNNYTYDIGLVNTYCIGDRVWLDENKNGIQEENESNFNENIEIELLDENNETATDANGDDVAPINSSDGTYQFCNLLSDKYKIKITPPDGYSVTIKDSGLDDEKDSDIDKSTNQSDVIELKDDDNLTIDIGLFKPTYCLGDFIWKDSNQDGVQDSGEDGVADINITLYNSKDEKLGADTTDSSGKYEFCGLSSDKYYIVVDKSTLPDGYKITTQNGGRDDTKDSDIDPDSGKSETVTISDSSNYTVDGGIYSPTYCLGDFIWRDSNQDGVQDSGEDGVADINITLYNSKDEKLGTDTTDSSGKYEFCGLSSDEYYIVVDKSTLPDGYKITTQNGGRDDTKDSDIDPDSGKSETVTISDSSNYTVDGGIYSPTYCLGDFIWRDSNQDGVQDSGEDGVADINITLYNSKDEKLGADTTDSSGKYEFCGLSSDDYYIVVDKSTLPDGYKITTQNGGRDDTKDSDIDPDSGKSDTITISDSSNYTVDGGIYSPTYCLGDFIWRDSNQDGVQDSGEDGVADINITLYNSKDEKLGTDTTDSSGKYEFCGLSSDEYYIVVDKSTLPDGYKITTQNGGRDDTKDSDIDPDSGKSETVTISDSSNYTVDGGIYSPTYCLGDFIWRDSNQDGVQDSGEDGVADINITLYNSKDEKLGADTTDSSGKYEFCGLSSDDYYIVVDKSTLPDGYKITTQNGGRDDTKDSDIDPNSGKSETVTISDSSNYTVDGGIYSPTYCLGDIIWDDHNHNGLQDKDEAGISEISITLNETGDETITDSKGEYKFCGLKNGDYSIQIDTSTLPENYKITTKNEGNDDANDSDIDPDSGKSDVVSIEDKDNYTLDGGIYAPTYCLGDFVWFDENSNGLQDSSESGVKSVDILLYNDNGVEIAKTTTDADGKYQFCNLKNGSYSISIDKSTIPNGYLITEKDVNRDNNKDSDIDQDSGKSDSITIKNEDDNSVDIGLYAPKYCLGDYIWFDDNKDGIQDSTESGVAEIRITLNETNETILTDSKGYYEFCNLKNGEYSITVDINSLPDGYEITTKNACSDDNKDSDIDPVTGESDSVKLQNNRVVSLDGGISSTTYCLGNFIWNDNNRNGIQDRGEEGIKDITITLNETGETTTTDELGYYQFCELDNGNYSITIEKSSIPEGFVITTPNMGDNGALDSDIDPDNGKSDVVSIRDGSNTTLDGGIYFKTYCLGDFIWLDKNKNGIQNRGESGVEGVKIYLNETNDVTTTNSNGYYRFCDLDNGIYSITVDKSTLPSGYDITAQNIGDDDTLDSDINPTDGKSDKITLSDSSNYSLDGGIFANVTITTIEPIPTPIPTLIPTATPTPTRIAHPEPPMRTPRPTPRPTLIPTATPTPTEKPNLCLGDTIWNDINNNGIQDGEENGVGDITISLYNSIGSKLDSSTTNSNGKYEFCNLTIGDYYIIVDKLSLPNGYSFTTKDSGTDDNRDSDINPNSGRSNTVTLSKDSNYSLDGGIHEDISTLAIEASNDTLTTAKLSMVTRNDILNATKDDETIVIPVLERSGFDNRARVKLVIIKDGDIYQAQDTAVGGTNIETTDRIVVPKEGVWTVEDNKLVFRAEEGFEGIPTPVHYVIEPKPEPQEIDCNCSCDNPDQAKDGCLCDDYQDSVPALNITSIILIIFLTTISSFIFFRKEDNINLQYKGNKMKNRKLLILIISTITLLNAGGDISSVTPYETTDVVEAEMEAVEVISPVEEVEPEIVKPRTPDIPKKPNKEPAKKPVVVAPKKPISDGVKSGLYVGVGAFMARYDANCVCVTDGKDTTGGGVVKVGYNVNKYIGIEARGVSTMIDDDGAKVTHYGVYLKPMLPVGKNLKLYSLVGTGKSKTTGKLRKADTEGLSFGVGADYDITDKISTFVDYQKVINKSDSNAPKLEIVSVGANYNF